MNQAIAAWSYLTICQHDFHQSEVFNKPTNPQTYERKTLIVEVQYTSCTAPKNDCTVDKKILGLSSDRPIWKFSFNRYRYRYAHFNISRYRYRYEENKFTDTDTDKKKKEFTDTDADTDMKNHQIPIPILSFFN